jgi:glucokinase
MTSVGIDLGEGRVTAVAVDESGSVIARGGTPASGHLATAARDAYRALRIGASPDRAGITVPFHAPSVPADISSAITRETGVAPVTITSGQAIALGEMWCGAARDHKDVVSFAMTQHVTAGILVGGRPLNGANGYAACVAWLTLNPVEREDYRRHGGLEAEVAAAGIVRRLVWRIKSGDRSLVTDRVDGDLSRLTAEHVFAGAREGDGVCVSVVRDTAKYVGMALANLAAVIDPECIVLSGTLATSGDLMLEPVRAECARRLCPGQSDKLRIVLSALGDDAAAIGAARAALLHNQ